MRTVKVFLASSSELHDDRKEFEILVNRRNKQWVDRDVFLDLVMWEDFVDALSKTRLQDEYNKAIRSCDLFVMLFCTKVGQYTEEEFETAFGQFQETRRPLVYTYFKDAPITTGSARREDLTTLWSFQDKLKTLGHFATTYQNVDGLRLHFGEQLDKLATSGVIGLDRKPVGPAPAAHGTSDLNVSPVGGARRLTPLDGHPVLSPATGPAPVFTGGFHVSFTLAHNGEGRQAISLHAMTLEVVSFAPDSRDEYHYRIEGGELIGAGMAKPHVFSISLFGERAGRAQWVLDARRGTSAEANTENFFDTDEPRVLTFAPEGSNEEIRGTVLAQDPGLYAVRFVFHYSVAGEDRQKQSDVIHVYSDE
jgi:hypothetical protein